MRQTVHSVAPIRNPTANRPGTPSGMRPASTSKRGEEGGVTQTRRKFWHSVCPPPYWRIGGGKIRKTRCGKPLETVGRKATELRRGGNPAAMSAGLQISKPSETMGRKANWGLNRHSCQGLRDRSCKVGRPGSGRRRAGRWLPFCRTGAPKTFAKPSQGPPSSSAKRAERREEQQVCSTPPP